MSRMRTGGDTATGVNTSTGATVTIDGRDTGLNPSDGYDPNPDDSDISSMKVIGTGAGRTEIHDLPAGWHVNAEQWDWKGRSGIRYEVWKGSANYNWFFAGATSFKHSVYELRSLDYYKTIDESPIAGYDWSRNQTLHGYIFNAQPGYHGVGWNGGCRYLSDRYRCQWIAPDDPNVTVTHDFIFDGGIKPTDWSQLKAFLPDGTAVTGFDPDGVSNKIPTDTKTVTWDGIPSGWTISDSYATKDRIITHFSKTGQHDKTVILYWTDDYEYSYTADQINYRNDEHCGLDVSVAPVALPSLAGEGRHGRSVHVAGPAGHRRHEPLSRKNKRARRAMPVAPQWGPHTIGIVKSTRVQHVQYTTTRRPTVGKSQWVREPWPPPIAVVRSTVLTSDLIEPKKASSRLPDPGTMGTPPGFFGEASGQQRAGSDPSVPHQLMVSYSSSPPLGAGVGCGAAGGV